MLPPAKVAAVRRWQTLFGGGTAKEPQKTQHSEAPLPEGGDLVLQWLLAQGEREASRVLYELAAKRPALMRKAACVADQEQTRCRPWWAQGRAGPPRKRSLAASTLPGSRGPCSPDASQHVPPSVNLVVAPLSEDAPAPASHQIRRGNALNFPRMTSSSEDRMAFSTEWGPVLQFSSSTYYQSAGDANAVLTVLRLGDLSELTEVYYRTRDDSGQAGSTYEAASGKITFEVGQSAHEIHIPLIAQKAWKPSLHFMVMLEQEGLVNGALGRYGSQAQVKVDSLMTFPLQESFEANYERTASHLTFAKQLDNAPKLGLFFAYVRWNLRDSLVCSGTLKILMKDQFHNLYFMLKLFLNVYLVDFVLKPTPASDRWLIGQGRPSSLFFIMGAMVTPIAVLHLLDYVSISWRVAGKSKMLLQSALMQRFLDYEDSSRFHLKNGDFVMAVTRDTDDLVCGGFMGLTRLAAQLGKLAMMLAYQLVAPAVFGNPLSNSAILGCVLPTIILPALLVLFLAARQSLLAQLCREERQRQTALLERVVGTVLNFRLIADYGRRDMAVDQFNRDIDSCNKVGRQVSRVEQNDVYFATWLTAVMVAVYTGFGGMQVLGGELPLGMFLTGVHIYMQIGEAWGHIYRSLLEICQAFPGLQRIVFLMNLTTDHRERKQLSSHCSHLAEALLKHMSPDVPHGERRDHLPIILENITCSYMVQSSTGSILRKEDMELQGRLHIEQGQLVSLVGPRGGGKSTLLKVLGGAMLPVFDGFTSVFVPGHLRVLHIGTEPAFFRGSLYANLTFGVPDGDPDGRVERVLSICRRLGLPDELLELVHLQDELAWDQVISLSQRHLLCIARGLIANPDVLVVHKPTLAFDEHTSALVLGLLKEFVDQRGIDAEEVYTVVLHRHAGVDLGLHFCANGGGSSSDCSLVSGGSGHSQAAILQVDSVGNAGLARAWNDDPLNRHSQIEQGDRVLEVNGIRGSAHELEAALSHEEVRMSLQRAGSWHRRRPRTCVVTSSKRAGVDIADKVFHVSAATGIQPQNKNEITPEMLI